MDTNILKEAKKHIDEPDYVLDLFDLQLVWMSENLKTLTEIDIKEGEIVTLRDVYELTNEYTREAFINRPDKQTDETVAMFKKIGKVRMVIKYEDFEMDKGKYRVGQVLEFERLEKR